MTCETSYQQLKGDIGGLVNAALGILAMAVLGPIWLIVYLALHHPAWLWGGLGLWLLWCHWREHRRKLAQAAAARRWEEAKEARRQQEMAGIAQKWGPLYHPQRWVNGRPVGPA